MIQDMEKSVRCICKWDKILNISVKYLIEFKLLKQNESCKSTNYQIFQHQWQMQWWMHMIPTNRRLRHKNKYKLKFRKCYVVRSRIASNNFKTVTEVQNHCRFMGNSNLWKLKQRIKRSYLEATEKIVEVTLTNNICSFIWSC